MCDSEANVVKPHGNINVIIRGKTSIHTEFYLLTHSMPSQRV